MKTRAEVEVVGGFSYVQELWQRERECSWGEVGTRRFSRIGGIWRSSCARKHSPRTDVRSLARLN